MYIETEKIIIRSFELNDVESYIKMASDGSLYEIFGDCKNCYKWMKDWIKKTIALDKEDNPYKEYLAYVILNKEIDIPVGAVGCSYYKDLKEIGITYFIGTSYRNRGYASEATRTYIEYFFCKYNVPRIIANVRIENMASCRVVEKAGFSYKTTKLYKDINDKQAQKYHFYEKIL